MCRKIDDYQFNAKQEQTAKDIDDRSKNFSADFNIIRYYSKKGTKISLGEYIALMQDNTYRQIRRTQIGDKIISTIWLGLDHRMTEYRRSNVPIIFETATMDNWDSITRHSTEQEAIHYHKKLCESLLSQN